MMQIPVMRWPGETSALNTTAGRRCYKLPCKSQAAPQCVIIIRVIVTYPLLFFIEKNYKRLKLINAERKHSVAIQRDEESRRESTASGECEQSHRLILANQSTCLTVITLSGQSDCSASLPGGRINRKLCDLLWK